MPDLLSERQYTPKITIVVPTLNDSQYISMTLQSILDQDYKGFEVIVLDGGSNDRTLETVKSFYDSRIRICNIAGYHRYEMLNKGISLALGTYLNFLFPGDFYLSRLTLSHIIEQSEQFNDPHLIYGACMLRPPGEDARVLFRSFNKKTMELGKQPTSLQACWFHYEAFKTVGKFAVHYTVRGGYELLCRFLLNTTMRVVSTRRVLTDYAFRPASKSRITGHFFETTKIIYIYFGLWSAFKWLFLQKDLYRIVKISLSKLRNAFFGYSR